jgi:Rod binding domain-containing protein
MPGPIQPNPSVRLPPHRSITGRSPAEAGSPRAEPGAAEQELKTACEEMEALFIHHLLSEMRKTVDKSGLMDGGRSEEIYTSLMDAELAKDMARAGGLGLSTILQEELGGLNGPPRGAFRKR